MIWTIISISLFCYFTFWNLEFQKLNNFTVVSVTVQLCRAKLTHSANEQGGSKFGWRGVCKANPSENLRVFRHIFMKKSAPKIVSDNWSPSSTNFQGPGAEPPKKFADLPLVKPFFDKKNQRKLTNKGGSKGVCQFRATYLYWSVNFIRFQNLSDNFV